MIRKYTSRRLVWLAMAVMTMVLLAGCLGTVDPPYMGYVVTQVNNNPIDIHNLDYQQPPDVLAQGDVVSVSTPSTNTADAGRIFFVSSNSPVNGDQESCATWSGASNTVNQFGVVLRGSGNSALVMTNNVYPTGGINYFNFYAWTPSGGLGNILVTANFSQQLGGNVLSFPTRVCGQVIGNQWKTKAWHPDSQSEPSWNDPSVFTLTVPAPWDSSTGQPGWYVGHLSPGQSMSFTAMTTPDPTATTTTTTTVPSSTTTVPSTTTSAPPDTTSTTAAPSSP